MKTLIVSLVGILGLGGCVTEFEEGEEGRYMNGCDRDFVRSPLTGNSPEYTVGKSSSQSSCVDIDKSAVELRVRADNFSCVLRGGSSNGEIETIDDENWIELQTQGRGLDLSNGEYHPLTLENCPKAIPFFCQGYPQFAGAMFIK